MDPAQQQPVSETSAAGGRSRPVAPSSKPSVDPVRAAEPAEDDLRTQSVRWAVELFEREGFEATSVADIAAAAGISRATFFRQVGGKEDAVFADHPPLLERIEAWMLQRLAEDGADAHVIVCEASLQVLSHLARDLPAARRRYGVVRSVAALREREIVTERRYERLFVQTLRAHLPQADSLGTVVFAAAVTAAHNHALRSLLRDEHAQQPQAVDAAVESLRAALKDLRARLATGSAGLGGETGEDGDGHGGPGAHGGPGVLDGGSRADSSAADAVTVVVATAPSSSDSGVDVDAVVEKVRRALS